MEERRPGQTGVEQDRPADAATAGRTVPADASEAGAHPEDRDAIRAGQQDGAAERADMRAAGFGSHKGTEAQ